MVTFLVDFLTFGLEVEILSFVFLGWDFEGVVVSGSEVVVSSWLSGTVVSSVSVVSVVTSEKI